MRLCLHALLVGCFMGCSRGQPPQFDAGEAGFTTIALVAPLVEADAAPPPREKNLTIDAGALPQTHDEPTASGEIFETRTRLLWEAIALDDPERAIPFFFPAAAYEQVKAIAHPLVDWRRRLVANFTRDIHALHAELGAHPENARFVRVEVPSGRARWMEPGDEGNKLGYYRVLGTKLRYEQGGRERTFDITSMISWRGEWYVVHLTGFK
ncbi:MAG: hypothetical protein ABIP39_04160 [Polyangiaceae bacterium]